MGDGVQSPFLEAHAVLLEDLDMRRAAAELEPPDLRAARDRTGRSTSSTMNVLGAITQVETSTMPMQIGPT